MLTTIFPNIFCTILNCEHIHVGTTYAINFPVFLEKIVYNSSCLWWIWRCRWKHNITFCFTWKCSIYLKSNITSRFFLPFRLFIFNFIRYANKIKLNLSTIYPTRRQRHGDKHAGEKGIYKEFFPQQFFVFVKIEVQTLKIHIYTCTYSECIHARRDGLSKQ